MKPTFSICRLGAQARVPNVDEIITQFDLQNICMKLTGQKCFNVIWKEKRINGKLFTLETDEKKFFITYTPHEVGGRNSYLQSVPTAFGIYLKESLENKKKCQFFLYFTSHIGENQTRYHQFMYRLLLSMEIGFINTEKELKGLSIQPFKEVQEIIAERDSNRMRNNANLSSYITDEGDCYHVYGKTFGANQKETAILCLALCKICNKPFRLFQISDNESNYLSKEDIKAIKLYAEKFTDTKIEILDDTYEFIEDDTHSYEQKTTEESLRSPRFIYNLLEKTGGHKCCELCHCQIDSIIQGAHIYPVQAIKQREDLTFGEKLKMATDKNNGIWLCENHHKLFDRGLIRFENGQMQIMPKLNTQDNIFVNKISTIKEINKDYYTKDMAEYFRKRDEFYHAEKYY